MATITSDFTKKLNDAKGKEAPYKVSDSESLYLLTSKAGTQTWYFQYRIMGVRQKATATAKAGEYALLLRTFKLGPYPTIGLVKARKLRDDAAKLVAEKKDPNEEQAKKLAATKVDKNTTLWPVVLEWLTKTARTEKWSEYYTTQAERFLTRYVQDGIGAMPIREIEPDHIATLLASIATRDKADKARGELKDEGAPHIAIRLRHHLDGVFKLARKDKLVDVNPVAVARESGDVDIKLPETRNNKALDPLELGALLRKIDEGGGMPRTLIGLKLLLLMFVRTGELRKATWDEFDLDHALWRIPAEKMKMRKPHFVPLSEQAIKLLRELREITGKPVGHNPDWLFPNMKDPSKPMDPNTLNHALVRLGLNGEQWFRGHGARGTAMTLLSEMGFNDKAIDRQLAHQERNAVRRAYDRAQHRDERTEMMQRWADTLDELRTQV
jgi:integrase